MGRGNSRVHADKRVYKIAIRFTVFLCTCCKRKLDLKLFLEQKQKIEELSHLIDDEQTKSKCPQIILLFFEKSKNVRYLDI